MGNENRENNQTAKNLQWGEHNPNLKDENFIDRKPQKISDSAELHTNVEQANTVTAVEEPGRRRQGTKEGEGNIELPL